MLLILPSYLFIAAKIDNPLADVFGVLLRRHDIPELGIGQAFSQIMRRRCCVRGVVSGYDQSRRLHCRDLFGLSSRRGIAIEKPASAGLDNSEVSVKILVAESCDKLFVPRNARCPGARLRVLKEAFRFAGARDDARQSLFTRKDRVALKSFLPVGFPAVAPNRPIEQERPHGLRKRYRERRSHGAAHAAADHKSGFYL